MPSTPVPPIESASSDPTIVRCFPCMHELRPHLSEVDFLHQVKAQQAESGYRLAYIADSSGTVVCVAGFRIAHFLAWGRALYLDDLATLSTARRQGHAGRMLDWLADVAKKEGCDSFHLDSGVARHDAHRLYLAKRFDIASHHFSKGV